MTALMLIPSLLLQKPHAKSKSTDHSKCLRDRLSSWKEGDIEKLMNEGRAIQSRLCQSRHPRSEVSHVRQCATLVEDGNLKAALRLLSDSNCKGTLPLNGTLDSGITVKERLQQLHPPSQRISEEAITTRAPAQDIHPIIYERINGNVIKSAALKASGAAGPSGMDLAAWK